jgi:hypothetical protein
MLTDTLMSQFAETWSPRHLVKPPTADYVKNVLLSAWRERYDGEGAVFDLFEKQKTGGSVRSRGTYAVTCRGLS